MTEYDGLSIYNTKNVCRACLRVSKGVFPMTTLEINAYRSYTNKLVMVWDMRICVGCRWLMGKCMKFTRQCQRACDLLSETLNMDAESQFLLNIPTVMDLRISRSETHYVGSEYPDLDEEKDDYMEDHVNDDDDEIPLVFLQDDKRKSVYEANEEPEVKLEVEIKEELTQDYEKVSKKRKKEIREGFSSRMVQETEEYVVIKLTRDQVLSEMAEKASAEPYVRSPYKCEKCVKGFNFEDVLQTHMEKHTREHGSYLCDICTQYCPSPVSLRGHLKSHTTRYRCKLCGQVRLSRQHLLEHHAITHTAAPTTYTCDKCQFTTNKRTVIQRHVKTHTTSERHACHRCGKLFNTIESLRVHTMRHDKSKRLQCEQCYKSFIYPSLLHKHVQAVHERKDYYCVECDVRFKSPESLRLHFKKAKRHRDSSSYKYECPHCSQRFVTSATLSVHLSSTHGAPKQHACAVCRRQYSSREALRAHCWRLHRRGEEAASCGQCDRSFTRKSILKVHMRTHTGERPHVCECGAAFTQTASLKLHQTAKHQKQEDLIQPGIDTAPNVPQEG